MALRDTVKAFVNLGPLPDQNADEDVIARHEAALRAISRPVSDEEAEALLACFGPDECYGLAWMLLHHIEAAPHLPTPSNELLRRSEWLRTVWKGPRATV